MLKSLSTQFVATLFFGPLGLAYSSMAAAVFLTLILAVLYFTELGALAVLIMWPIAILAGLVLVKLHNDQIRSSGGTLLLGPDGEEPQVSTFGSWGRGIAVLSILAVGGYLAYWYTSASENAGSEASNRVVDESSSNTSLSGSIVEVDNNEADLQSDNDLDIATTYPLDAVVVPSSVQSESTFSWGATDQEAAEPVVIDTASQPQVESENLLYVDSELVNLRDGPGTNFEILSQVERGDELAEVERRGSWINVTATESGATGWIFGRLVSSQR